MHSWYVMKFGFFSDFGVRELGFQRKTRTSSEVVVVATASQVVLYPALATARKNASVSAPLFAASVIAVP